MIAAELDAVAVAGDAASPEDMQRAIGACRDLGGLDVLVANAGGESGGAAADTRDDEWESSLRSNLTSAFVCARAAVPELRARGGGSIVIVASEAALTAPPRLAGYVSAKTALLGLTRSLAVDYGPEGIRCNAVCPGWVRTPMGDDYLGGIAAARGISIDEAYVLASCRLPLRRPATPEEIATVCLFLACDDSAFVTGTVLPVDGGASAVDVGTIELGPRG